MYRAEEITILKVLRKLAQTVQLQPQHREEMLRGNEWGYLIPQGGKYRKHIRGGGRWELLWHFTFEGEYKKKKKGHTHGILSGHI